MFMLRLTEEEYGWLLELSKMTGLAKADVVRMGIRKEYEERHEEPTPVHWSSRKKVPLHAKKHPRSKP
jgi:hypothetical protein